MMKNAIGFYMQRKATLQGTPLVGWDFPLRTDLDTLADYLGGTEIAGGKLKEIGLLHWLYPNNGADNSSGFEARGTGYRSYEGVFGDLKRWSHFLTKTIYYQEAIYIRALRNDTPIFYWGTTVKRHGHPVRLIKNTTSLSDGQTGTVTDIDGNVYPTICIGTQEWMMENLKVTHFNDGTLIPNVTNGSEWGSLETPGMCWYDNLVDNKHVYGGLYNWFFANHGL